MKSPDRHHPSAETPGGDARHPLDWPARAGAVHDVIRAMNLRVATRRRRNRRLLATAVAALVVGAISSYFLQRGAEPAANLTRASAMLAQAERQILPDGSTIELKPGARCSVGYDSRVRRVRLHQGEAYFEVVKDPARPFIVEAGHVEFRAVGTVFTVQRDLGTVELLVTEGRVAVKPTAAPAANPPPDLTAEPAGVVIAAGSRAVVAKGTQMMAADVKIEELSPREIRQRVAWRVPLLELSATPLGQVVQVFSRYSGQRLVLADEQLAQVRLSGVLRADNVDTLLGLLEESHVRVAQNAAGDIVLHRR